MCFSMKSLEVFCKAVVGEVLSVDKADCFGPPSPSHTKAITQLDVLFIFSLSDNPAIGIDFFCFAPCWILWKCKKVFD